MNGRCCQSLDAYERSLQIRRGDYGRTGGWVLERNGLPIAILHTPRWEDMFWVSYELEPVTEDLELRQLLATERFWKSEEWADLVWRSREFGDVADGPFPAGSPFTQDGRLNMRALYLRPPEPAPGGVVDTILRVVVAIRRASRQARGRRQRR